MKPWDLPRAVFHTNAQQATVVRPREIKLYLTVVAKSAWLLSVRIAPNVKHHSVTNTASDSISADRIAIFISLFKFVLKASFYVINLQCLWDIVHFSLGQNAAERLPCVKSHWNFLQSNNFCQQISGCLILTSTPECINLSFRYLRQTSFLHFIPASFKLEVYRTDLNNFWGNMNEIRR